MFCMKCDFKQNVVVLILGGNLDFTRKLKQILIHKLIKHSFQKYSWENYVSNGKREREKEREKHDFYLPLYTKISSRLMDLAMKDKTTKFLDKNKGDDLHGFCHKKNNLPTSLH